MSSSLQSHGLQHARLPCPSLSPGVCSNACPLSRWCHRTISSSVPTAPPASNPSQHEAKWCLCFSIHWSVTPPDNQANWRSEASPSAGSFLRVLWFEHLRLKKFGWVKEGLHLQASSRIRHELFNSQQATWHPKDLSWKPLLTSFNGQLLIFLIKKQIQWEPESLCWSWDKPHYTQHPRETQGFFLGRFKVRKTCSRQHNMERTILTPSTYSYNSYSCNVIPESPGRDSIKAGQMKKQMNRVLPGLCWSCPWLLTTCDRRPWALCVALPQTFLGNNYKVESSKMCHLCGHTHWSFPLSVILSSHLCFCDHWLLSPLSQAISRC